MDKYVIQSADEFARLRTSDVPEEYHLAAHGTASDDVWLEVINRFPDLISWVIHNKTVPMWVLERFAESDDVGLRMDVAHKRKLSFDLFELLSKDQDSSVRLSVAGNAKVPDEVLKALQFDDDAGVREKAKKVWQVRALKKS